MDKEIDPRFPCSACGREVPLSEAVVPEASNYVAYFCGLDCYAQWHRRAEAFLMASIRWPVPERVTV